jgi:hypothetical protein
MKKVAILQSNYIPWKGYFDLIKTVDIFVVYDDVQYTKNDWRNRNIIKTPNGTMWLTIPVRQTGLFQKINETYVAQNNWNKKHWNSITVNYSKAPYFKHFEAEFNRLYSSMESQNLSDINQIFIKKINEILDIQTEIIDSRSLELLGDRNERIIDAVKKLKGTHYISGPAAKSYLDLNKFESESIQVEWFNYHGYQEYSQLFGDFTHNVSIIDLIFNEGPKALNFLKST